MIKWNEKHADEPSYEGLVMSGVQRTSHFLMSDYGIGLYVIVWDPSKHDTKQVSVGYEDFGVDWYTEGGSDGITVDATPEVLEAHRIKQAEERWADCMIGELREELEVTTGKAVEVFKGRKVPVGTTGIVRWMGAGRYGIRVGLKVEGQDKLVYTAVDNVRVDQSAAGRALQAAVKAEREAWQHKADEAAQGLDKGMTVKVVSGRDAGKVGVIFWLKGHRLGIKANPKDRSEEPVWANATQVVAG